MNSSRLNIIQARPFKRAGSLSRKVKERSISIGDGGAGEREAVGQVNCGGKIAVGFFRKAFGKACAGLFNFLAVHKE